MRPRKLTMRAFGPYPSEQVIDFDLLKENSLFLIHGPTGSGKTTILDAICFALYGETSGGYRQAKQIRSDHADPKTASEVILDFRLGEKTFRVYRHPEQQISSKKNPEKTSTAKAKAALWDIGIDPPKVLASKWTTVTAQIEELLGFRSEQFRQVVVLPQGEFRQLLLADSKERQNILEILFRTEIFRTIEEALKASAKDLEIRMKELDQRINFILEQSGTGNKDELAIELAATENKFTALQTAIEELKTSEKLCLEALSQGRAVQDKFNEYERALKHKRMLEQQTTKFDEKRNTLSLAVKAAALKPLEKAMEARSLESEQARESVNAAKKRLEKAESDRKRAEKRVAETKDSEDAVAEMKSRLKYFAELSLRVDDLQRSLMAEAEAKKALSKITDRFKKTQTKLKSLGDELAAASSSLAEAEKTAANAELLGMKSVELGRALELRKKLTELLADQASAAKNLEANQAELSGAELEFKTADEKRKTLEDHWIKGQSAVLAKKLSPGEPCPVCGSTSHPNPSAADFHVPSDQEMKRSGNALDRLRTKLENLGLQNVELQGKLRQIQSVAEICRENLGELNSLGESELARELKRVKGDLVAAENASKEVSLLGARKQILESDQERLQKEQSDLEQELLEAQSLFRKKQAESDAKRENVPEQYRDPNDLALAAESAEKTIRSLEANYKKAQNEFIKANEMVASAVEAVKGAQDASILADSRLLNQREDFGKSLLKAGFPDQATYAKSKKTQAEIERLQGEIEAFDKEFVGASAGAARAEKEIAGLSKPDIDQLKAAHEAARLNLEKALKEGGVLAERLKSLKKWWRDHALESKALDSLTQEYEIMGRISEVANGNNRDRITFQRFVLASFLDDVTTAATARLQIMSNGRFLLQRVLQVGNRRYPSGLDLEIHDTYTGTERPVSTLSGGESFLASLSLALGLADVVQAYAGGIHLDTMFIDEGFGSLDPEALDSALRALIDLQRNGRLVGVISHVPELRERIDVRLEISSGRKGSSAKFVFCLNRGSKKVKNLVVLELTRG